MELSIPLENFKFLKSVVKCALNIQKRLGATVQNLLKFKKRFAEFT